jgi:uncharacterized Tic20 family protein
MSAYTPNWVQSPPTGSDKIWAILSHLSLFMGLPFIIPFAVYLAMRNDTGYVAENAAEALNFHISLLLYALCVVPFLLIFIGLPLLFMMGVAAIALTIVATVRASEGECYRYPLTLRLV